MEGRSSSWAVSHLLQDIDNDTISSAHLIACDYSFLLRRLNMWRLCWLSCIKSTCSGTACRTGHLLLQSEAQRRKQIWKSERLCHELQRTLQERV